MSDIERLPDAPEGDYDRRCEVSDDDCVRYDNCAAARAGMTIAVLRRYLKTHTCPFCGGHLSGPQLLYRCDTCGRDPWRILNR